jgi:hypothetical protein
LLRDALTRGEFISPAVTTANSAYNKLKINVEYPKGLTRAALSLILAQLETEGVITQQSFTDNYRNQRQRYALTS